MCVQLQILNSQLKSSSGQSEISARLALTRVNSRTRGRVKAAFKESLPMQLHVRAAVLWITWRSQLIQVHSTGADEWFCAGRSVNGGYVIVRPTGETDNCYSLRGMLIRQTVVLVALTVPARNSKPRCVHGVLVNFRRNLKGVGSDFPETQFYLNISLLTEQSSYTSALFAARTNGRKKVWLWLISKCRGIK